MAIGGWGKRVSQGILHQASWPIAIDFGVAALKVLQLDSGPPVRFVAAACLETPGELLTDTPKRFEFQSLALPKIIKAGGFTVRRAVCGIPAGQSLCKHIQLAPGDEASIAAQVRGVVAAQVGCDAEALMCRHVDVGVVGRNAGQNKTEVIAMAAARESITRFLDAIKGAKLEMVGMHAEYAASLKALSWMFPDVQPPTLLIDLGYSSTKVSVAYEGKLVFARTIEMAARQMDHAIIKAIRCDHAEARHVRQNLADLSGTNAAPADAASSAGGTATAVEVDRTTKLALRAVAEPVEIIADEIAMCLRYFDSMVPGKRPARAVFLGGGARHDALVKRLAAALRVEPTVANPMTRVARGGREPCRGVDFGTAQPAWATALGLAISPTDF